MQFIFLSVDNTTISPPTEGKGRLYCPGLSIRGNVCMYLETGSGFMIGIVIGILGFIIVVILGVIWSLKRRVHRFVREFFIDRNLNLPH